MSDREIVLDTVQRMPPQTTLAEILEELSFLATLRERLGRVDRGEVKGVPAVEVLQRVRSWTTE